MDSFCGGNTVGEVLWSSGPSECTSYLILPFLITATALGNLLSSRKRPHHPSNLIFKLSISLFAISSIIHTVIEVLQKHHSFHKFIADTSLVASFTVIIAIATQKVGFFRWHAFCLIFALSRINILWNDFHKRSAEGKSITLAEGFHWASLLFGLLITISFPGKSGSRRPSEHLSTELLLLDSDESEPQHPEASAPWLQFLVFGWLTPVITTAYNKDAAGEALLREDLPPIEKRDRSLICYEKLEAAWEIEENSGRRSLAHALIRAFWKELGTSACVKLVNDLLHFANPILLSHLMTFLSEEDGNVWVGWSLALGMCFVSTCQSFALAHYFQLGYRVGMHVRSAAVLLICTKSLRICPSSLAPPAEEEAPEEPNTTCSWCPRMCCFCCQPATSQVYHGGTGEIVNLITADCDRFAWLCPYINLVWSAPFQLILCFIFLFYFVGWSFMGSMLIMACNGAFTSWVQVKSVAVQKRVMKVKDERLKVQNELINAIKMVKVYGWEHSMQDRVAEIRDRELALQLKFKLLGGLQMLQFSVAPLFISASCFFVFTVILKQDLTPQIVYPAMTLFGILSFPLAALPMMLNFLAQAQVSVRRIEDFMQKNEVSGLPPISTDGGSALELKFDTLKWSNGAPLLEGPAHIVLKKDEFITIAGATGSGKSGLLDALTGELSCNLQLKTRGEIRLVTQTPWIRSATVRENIVGDAAFDYENYQETLRVCSLLTDLEVLPDGDATIVGNRGVMLSGGQRVRVALARAVYSTRASVFIFDDILSAVDAHVGKHILNECICGRLKGKTVVLATHSTSAIHASTRVIHLEGKRIAYDGPSRGWDGFSKITEIETAGKTVAQNSPQISEVKEKAIAREEQRSVGAISWQVYRKLFSAMGGIPSVGPFIIVLIICEVGRTSSDVWLQHWVGERGYDPLKGIGWYIFFACMIGVLSFGLITTRIFVGQKAARKLHLDCQFSVLRATMAFLDVTPSGRIINRLSEDTVLVDNNLPVTLSLNCQWFLRMIIIFVMCCFVSPFIGLVALPIMYVFSRTQKFYVPSARDLRRLDSTAKGPIFNHIGEILNGLSTIRVHRIQDPMHAMNVTNLDTQNQAYFLNCTSNRWLSVRMQLLGAFLVSVTTFCIIALRSKIRPEIAGLVIAYAMRLTDTLSSLNRESADRETQMVCAERLMEYSDESQVPLEAPLSLATPPDMWPQGDFEWKEVSVRYRPDLPQVLRDVSFRVKKGTSLGICGRTGSGKSSLLNAMMRIVEIDKGKQILDGIDISKIGLHDLRSKMLIVPQDPVVFSGDVRFNLDPFHEKSDEHLWEGITRAGLKDKIESLGGLDSSVGDAGKNFSHGERQLLALTRALVRKTSYGMLLLDEATSSVDEDLDARIQRVVSSDFLDEGITVVSIAHRLKTIINYDNIAVLHDGELREYGPARELYQQGGLFTSLADEAGLRSEFS